MYFRNENNTAKCSSATFKLDGYYDERCLDTSLHEQFNFVHEEVRTLALQTRTSIEINLADLYLNGWEDSPAMIWIALQSGTFIMLNCCRSLELNDSNPMARLPWLIRTRF